MKKILYATLLLFLCLPALQAQGCFPHAICNHPVTVILGTDGVATLTGDDVSDLVWSEFCRDEIELEIEIRDAAQNVLYPISDSIELNCATLGDQWQVTLYVSKETTTNSCSADLIIRDPHGECLNFGPDTIPVVFNRYAYSAGRVPAGQLSVRHNGSPLPEHTDGVFILKNSDIPSGLNTLEFDDSEGDIFGTLTARDVIEGFRGFFEEPLTPIKAMVLDVDGSSSMSVDDVILIQTYLLGLISDFNGRNFLILPYDRLIPPDFDVYDFGIDPSVFTFDGDTVDRVNFTFDAISMGDVSDAPDSLVNGRLQTRNTAEALLEFDDRYVTAGQPVDITFTAHMTDAMLLRGFQFAIDAANCTSISGETLNGKTGWMTYDTDENFRLCYASISDHLQVPFTLTMVPAHSGYLSDLLQLSGDFHREAVSHEMLSHPVSLHPLESPGPTATVSPNPFTRELRITVPDNGPANLQLMDLTGRVLDKWQSPGGEALRLDLPDLASGVYMLRMHQAGKHQIFRLIRT